MKIGDEFLIICRENYFNKITPSNTDSIHKEGYKRLVEIAKEYFRINEYDKFIEFFKEGQYFIALWAAHLILAFGNPDQKTKDKALNVIKKYSENPLSEEVSSEEKTWLKANGF